MASDKKTIKNILENESQYQPDLFQLYLKDLSHIPLLSKE